MNKIITSLMVANVNETIKFYQEILDFKFTVGEDLKHEIVTDAVKKHSLEWGIIKNGHVELMLQKTSNFANDFPEFSSNKSGGSFALYINMQDVQSLYNKIKDKVEIVKDIYQTVYEADEFIIRDLNGYMIYFSEI